MNIGEGINSHTKTRVAFDYDDIENWGPELSDVLADILPKRLDRIFAAEPPDDVEHAREIVLSHLNARPRGLVYRLRHWFCMKNVCAYFPMYGSDGDIDLVTRYGVSQSLDDTRIRRLRDALSENSRFAAASHRFEPAVKRALHTMPALRERRILLSPSRACLVSDFDQHASEFAAFEEAVAKDLLGDDGVRDLRDRGRFILHLSISGAGVLYYARNWAPHADKELPNFLREVFESWAFWLSDPDFSPADERLFIGLAPRRDMPATAVVGVEKIIAD